MVSADFPGLDYESAALTAELRARVLFCYNITRYLQTAHFRL